jgi:hypothetical protein
MLHGLSSCTGRRRVFNANQTVLGLKLVLEIQIDLCYTRAESGTSFFSVFIVLEVDMKRFLLLSVGLLLVASLAFAQAGSIGLFSTPLANNCDVYDAAPGLLLVYVIHVFSPGATAAQFIVNDVTWLAGTLTPLAEAATAPYIKIGTCAMSLGGGGCAIAFGSCVGTPNMMLTIQYFGSGLEPPCGYIQVMADPSATPPGIYVTDCSSPPLLLNATGGDVVVNPDPSCFCNIPVEETSWGNIKNLYK